MFQGEQYDVLREAFGEEQAAEILRLSKNFDKYLGRVKKKLNKMLNTAGYEVLVGYTVQPIQRKEIE